MALRPVTYICIAITFGSLLFLSEVRHRLNGADQQRRLAAFWKKKTAQEQLNKMVALGKFADFKQEVALLIPHEYTKKKLAEDKNRLRDLASIIPQERRPIALGSSAKKLLDEGKQHVVKHEYQKGIQVLEKLIHEFPDSHHNIEAYYLITEAYANMEKDQKVVEWAEAMVELFPENRLTGFAMLKLGLVYEKESRHEDALQIYKTILSVYDDPSLASQAKTSAKKLEL